MWIKAKLYILGRLRQTAIAIPYQKDICSKPPRTPRLPAEKLFETGRPEYHTFSYVCTRLKTTPIELRRKVKKDLKSKSSKNTKRLEDKKT